jgi:hypothetical protein
MGSTVRSGSPAGAPLAAGCWAPAGLNDRSPANGTAAVLILCHMW